MADQTRITNFPDSGSAERVAFDLFKIIWQANSHNSSEGFVLDTYAKCLRATQGQRLVND